MSTTFGAETTAQEVVDALVSNIRGKNGACLSFILMYVLH